MCPRDRQHAPRAAPGAQGPLLDRRGVRRDARRVRRLQAELLVLVVSSITFVQVVLAIHILAVVVGFGGVFAFPPLFGALARTDPQAIPSLLRARQRLGRYLINPGLLFVVLAGTAVPDGGQRTSATWSEEYADGLRRFTLASNAMALIVMVTIFFMATH